MVSKQRSKGTVCGAASSARLCPWGLLSFSRTLRAHLPLDINFRGCMKGFQFQKKDFNLLEQTETLGVGYGCPEDSLVSTIQPRAFSRVNRPLSTVRSTSSASLGSFLLTGERKLIKLERLVGLSVTCAAAPASSGWGIHAHRGCSDAGGHSGVRNGKAESQLPQEHGKKASMPEFQQKPNWNTNCLPNRQGSLYIKTDIKSP